MNIITELAQEKSIRNAFIIGVIIVMALGFYIHSEIVWYREHPCIRSHVEHQWVQPAPIYIKSGSVLIPIPQAGYFEDCTICDERANMDL